MSHVQTSGSAQKDPELFPADPPRVVTARHDTQLEFHGRLRGRAHVANKLCDSEGHMVPVVVLELEDVGAGHHQVRAEIPHTEATRRDAERLARQLQPGQEITLSHALTGMRIFLPAAAISLHPTLKGNS